jgi:hypothetical protein
MLNRRHFLVSTTALAVTASPALAALDPTDADIKFGTTGSIFGAWNGPAGAMKMSTDMRMMLEDVKHYGLEGFEPYSGQVGQWLDKPLELKKLCQEVGVTFIDVGDLPRRRIRQPLVVHLPGLSLAGRRKGATDRQHGGVARDFLQPWARSLEEQYKGPPAGPAKTSRAAGRYRQ